MWLLESDDESLGGRRLWLRPGKTYLFGRTAAEAGQLAISHNTISRKHLTITVADVEPGDAYILSSRSRLTIEDLATKIGTFVNGHKIKGEKHVVEQEETEIVMGKCPSKFRITWNPVVLTFSFTSKELQNQPLTTLQEKFEKLDIKLLTEYHTKCTTLVVAKKRNTAKGLQALINAKHIVNETFLDAVLAASDPNGDEEGGGSSPLEQDFQQHWPNAMDHLPPPGGEPVQHPNDIYAPDSGRLDIFEGYTFIFYDQTQYNNLIAPINSGGGKAFHENVTPEQTEVDDFVRYVKSVAGEKGLGSFEDGSEGRGVVLVRYVPAKGAHVPWYTNFFTSVSLRLDHRPIEQSEFLEAILIKDASILRRPLEIESSAPESLEPRSRGRNRTEGTSQLEAAQDDRVSASAEVEAEPPQPASTRPRSGRRTVKRRFAGFDASDDIDMDDIPPAPVQGSNGNLEDEEGLFVSQQPSQDVDQASNSRRSQRKRPASPPPEDDLMGGMAPAAARFKRQRIERGETFASPSPEPEARPKNTEPKKKVKKEVDILAAVAQNRQQEEDRARREKEDLENLPDDVDLAEIRRLNIVEEMEVRQPAGASRTREQDIADGRWDPKWNGMKNFKKFQRRGEATGRLPAKVIVPLTVVKNKEFGVGDDYWLDDDDNSQQKKKTDSQPSLMGSENIAPTASERSTRKTGVVLSSDSEQEEESALAMESSLSQSRKQGQSGKTAASQARGSAATTQSSRQTGSGKRAAADPPKQQPAKRQRAARKVMEVPDSEDSDDELKFRFGKRK